MLNNFHITAEKFKETCLRNGSDFTSDYNEILDQFFDPEEKINIINKNDVDTLKLYLTGGLSYDLFKKNSKN
jgi:hypothetical protein